mgnify:CR=1 FL=1
MMIPLVLLVLWSIVPNVMALNTCAATRATTISRRKKATTQSRSFAEQKKAPMHDEQNPRARHTPKDGSSSDPWDVSSLSLSSSSSSSMTRRSWLLQRAPRSLLAATATAATAAFTLCTDAQQHAVAAEVPSTTTTSTPSTTTTFRTKAYNLKEYTNSIVASKDTNVSPKEAYDVLAETIQPVAQGMANKNHKHTATSSNNPNNNNNNAYRALDVGAGAGVSTQTLYEMGFTQMDAVDWSGAAWDANVEACPPSVQFYEMDDERFFQQLAATGRRDQKYQVIVYNFAINLDKAIRVAKDYLDPTSDQARLLVPANAQRDYWYKQTYYLLDNKGEIVWKSKPMVGAWDV